MHAYALDGVQNLCLSGFLQQLPVLSKKIQALHLFFYLHILV